MAEASAKKTPSPEGGTDISNQENVSSRTSAARQSSKQQVRHRASVACASCRDRRIRCVVPKGESECTQCKRTGQECVIKNDDERRRPISKAYMSSLSDRINMLESLLLDKGVVPPPAAHPPKTRHEAPSKPEDEKLRRGSMSETPHQLGLHDSVGMPIHEVPSPPDSADDYALHDGDMGDSALMLTNDSHIPTKEQSPFRMLDPKQEDSIHRILTTEGNLSFDQLTGLVRFFGPTANSHVYAESSDEYDSREPPEQVRRAERIIRSLSSSTYEYLMSLFWEYYNSFLQVIDQEAFEADRDSQNPKFYSSFLHISVLAMAYRFADKDREDMIRISLGNRESILHREAKYMLDVELERPGGLSSVQALLILSDLECGVGRDKTGWMYSGMANRLAFDIGLHLDCSNNGLSEREVRIRHMVMRACVIFDKYWALFLGRPTSIKNQDIGLDLLSRRFSQTLGSLSGAPTTKAATDRKSMDADIYDQLVELMELAGRIVEIRENHKRDHGIVDHTATMNEAEDHGYLNVVNLDRQLQNWYRRLPDHLKWKPSNIKTAPFSYFLLHQQYHVSMILLHRPWAKYQRSSDGSSPGSQPSPEDAVHSLDTSHYASALTGHAIGLGDPTCIVDDSRTSLSRSICTQQAIRVARIFWQHRQRFNGKKICVRGIQHAGTAAIALIAALAYQRNETDKRSYLSYLEILSDAIHDMSETYHPAWRMDDVMQLVVKQFRDDLPAGQHVRTNSFGASLSISANSSNFDIPSVLPARRENPDADQLRRSKKRPRPTASRRASEFSRPIPPFFAQPTPPNSSQNHSTPGSGIHHHASSMSGVFGGFGEVPVGFPLDALSGSAVDAEMADDLPSQTGRAEDYVLVPPATEHWGLHEIDVEPHSYPTQDFAFQMSDWVGGPAGLSASTVLSGSAQSAAPENTEAAEPTKTGGLRPSLGEGMSSSIRGDQHAAPGDEKSGPGFIRNEESMNALSPVSLGGLVQSVEKAAGADGNLGETAPRNHELDFFSF